MKQKKERIEWNNKNKIKISIYFIGPIISYIIFLFYFLYLSDIFELFKEQLRNIFNDSTYIFLIGIFFLGMWKFSVIIYEGFSLFYPKNNKEEKEAKAIQIEKLIKERRKFDRKINLKIRKIKNG